MENHKADPNRPYKAYAGMLLAALMYLLAHSEVLGTIGTLIVGCLVAGIGVYVTPNPVKGVRRK